MKREMNLILSLLIAATFLSGCTNKNDTPQSEIEILNAESQNQVILANETSGVDVNFSTPDAWYSRVTLQNPVQGMASWIRINPDKGNAAGKYTVSISLDPNTSKNDRVAGIILASNGKSLNINVTQKGKESTNGNKQAWEKYLVRDNLTTQDLVDEMGLGINLGNTMEACGDWINPGNILNYEQAWGAPVTTKKIIAGYANAGFSSLRIPVSWSNMMLADYTINPALLARVDSIVNWTIDNGMIAMVNEHWDGGWLTNYPTNKVEVTKKFTKMWQQISDHFRNYGDHLLFESMNEVGFDSIWTPWSGGPAQKKEAFGYVNELNQTFVDVVRASGGNNAKRHLVIEVYNTGLEYAYDPNFKMPTDPANRCAATVHYYTPAVFAILGADADWGKARATWGTDADFKELNDNMDNLKKNCVDKGIPIIVGEFAACGGNKTEEMVRLYGVSVSEAVYSRRMCPMLWDTPNWQYNRVTYKFNDPLYIEQLNAIKVNHPR